MDKDNKIEIIKIIGLVVSFIALLIALFILIKLVVEEVDKENDTYKTCVESDYEIYLNDNLIGKDAALELDSYSYDVNIDNVNKRVYLTKQEGGEFGGALLSMIIIMLIFSGGRRRR